MTGDEPDDWDSDRDKLGDLVFMFHYDQSGNAGCSVTAPTLCAALGLCPDLTSSMMVEVWFVETPVWTRDNGDGSEKEWDDAINAPPSANQFLHRHEWDFR